MASSAFEKDLEVVTDNHFSMILLYHALAEALLQWGAIHRIKLSCNLNYWQDYCEITLTRLVFHILKKSANSRQSSIEREIFQKTKTLEA